MAKRFIIILQLTLLVLVAPTAIRAGGTYTPLPPALDGSMMPFDFSACTQTPYLPDSLRPVYAAYVARHGARYLSGPSKMKPVMKELIKGRNSGTLSATGEAFLTLMEKVEEANTDNWGDLSPIGISEERRLGRRIFETLPQLAQPGSPIHAVSSHIPRVVMTMYQFSNQIIRLNDDVTVLTDEGTQFSPLVCCFIADKEYAEYRKNGDWKPVYDDFVDRNVPVGPAERLFTVTGLSDRKLRELTLDMYEVLKGNRAAGLPAPTTQWMSVSEYHACWRASNLQHYLRNSITPLSDIAGKATSPLLRQIIADIDRGVAAETASPVMNAYFGHAETLLPLLSLIRVPACNDLRLDYDRLDDCWKIQELTPLGANLLILLAEGPSGEKYAMIQLNGRTIRPVRGHGDIVSWPMLRAYWQNLMVFDR